MRGAACMTLALLAAEQVAQAGLSRFGTVLPMSRGLWQSRNPPTDKRQTRPRKRTETGSIFATFLHMLKVSSFLISGANWRSLERQDKLYQLKVESGLVRRKGTDQAGIYGSTFFAEPVHPIL